MQCDAVRKTVGAIRVPEQMTCFSPWKSTINAPTLPKALPVIWPLTIVVPWLLAPVFASVPWLGAVGVRQGVVAALVVALVVYVVMPRYVRLIAGWLYSRPAPKA